MMRWAQWWSWSSKVAELPGGGDGGGGHGHGRGGGPRL